MSQYRLTGNYGTFEIQRVVEADDYEDAFAATGIVIDMENIGWVFTEEPDGEMWTIEMLVDGVWVEQDDPEFGDPRNDDPVDPRNSEMEAIRLDHLKER